MKAIFTPGGVLLIEVPFETNITGTSTLNYGDTSFYLDIDFAGQDTICAESAF